jgi:hypothetical protein
MSTLCHKTSNLVVINGSFIQTTDANDGTSCERKGNGNEGREVIGGYGDGRLAIYILH